MKARAMRHLAGEVRRLGREESGVALMLTLAVFLLLYVLCCSVFATAEIIHQRMQLQNACDAAAYSAAVVQADGLSRMAVVNRALAWTYIQLCREQMDYIVYKWLWLTWDRFKYDWHHKAEEAGFWKFQHYNFKDFDRLIKPIVKAIGYMCGYTRYEAGLHCRFSCHGEEGCGWHIGVEDSSGKRYKRCVSLNGRIDNGADFVDAEVIGGLVDGLHERKWDEHVMELIDGHKKAISQLNTMLGSLNTSMRKSIQQTVQFVLFENLPKDGDGKLHLDEMGDIYWAVSGGMSAAPEAYRMNGFLVEEEEEGEEGSGATGSFFDALSNTEEDEIQFLTMADGVPGRQAGAPGWMQGRPVVLSDYFGLSVDGVEDPTQTEDGITRYAAGGLDQWFVRGTTEEATSGKRIVEKGFRDPPAGIQRVYKHSNREEGGQWRIRTHYRPNHVFRGDISAIGRMNFGEYRYFFDLEQILNWILPGDYTATVLIYGSAVVTGGASTTIAEALKQAIIQAVGGAIESVISSIVSQFSNVIDIPASCDHTQDRYPDQCHNVKETTGLVAQYEWQSAYWMCPWSISKRPFHRKKTKKYGHFRLPLAEFMGCKEHGYGRFMTWLPKEVAVLARGGSARNEYESCFINFDGTKDANRNTHLRGYARIYGDDKDIFDPQYYVGEVACPWILSESFFNGDGTILVGLARRQRNPFRKLVANAVELVAKGKEVENPSLYEPFSPQPGADRFLVALSAARAVWAPRPDNPGTGLESMNGTGTPTAPGQYEPRYDAVTDHYNGKSFKIVDNPLKSAHMGCVCGTPDTQRRLLRMWNLSQTDWDAALLPLRHAFGSHTFYDSAVNLGAGTEWEFDDPEKNSVDKLVARLAALEWSCMTAGGRRVDSEDILAFPVPRDSGARKTMVTDPSDWWKWEFEEAESGGSGGNTGDRGTLKQMFVYRRLL
ncbi:MAG: hypothetical protein IKQ15_06720 [Kiritimatiellae bacterium]|nr:hypothetical protein [Kiritimatiellia bacterium]